ncbi:MAG TPA: GNAT family N-acetyltransferase [Mycobacteriales bacterium]|jgi:RimJ/RimL family protein N-acetyltransferase|nr:GNAT family N-acetyltransferase [Mycobacteriales bacterium]
MGSRRLERTEIGVGRLRLRPWQPGDAGALQRLLDDPEVARWTPHPSPYTLDHAKARLADDDVHWAGGTRAELAVLDAATGELLGAVGLYSVEQSQAEVGWVVAAGARGRGLASEALPALCRWAWDTVGLTRLEARVLVGNIASRAVAEKCGFRLEGTRRTPGSETWVLSLLPTDELVDRRPLPASLRLGDGVVTLRRWAASDAADVARAGEDPDMARWLPVPSPYTLSDASAYVGTLVGRECADGVAAHAAVVDAAEGALLGAVSLKLPLRELGVGEIGYWTAPWARRRGVASRAAALLGRWGLEELRLGRVELLADVDNLASRRVAERAGYVREGIARQARAAVRAPGRRDFVLYSLVAADLARREVR